MKKEITIKETDHKKDSRHKWWHFMSGTWKKSLKDGVLVEKSTTETCDRCGYERRKTIRYISEL